MGNSLLELMQKQGLTQISLAKKSGVSQSYISKLCLNKSNCPSLDKAKRLADALGVSVEQIFGNISGQCEDVSKLFEPTQIEIEYLRKLRFLSNSDRSIVYSVIDTYYELAKEGKRGEEFSSSEEDAKSAFAL